MRTKAKKLMIKEWQRKLGEAVCNGDIDLIVECLANGADINADEDGDYNTLNIPLNMAIKNGQDETAIFLMEGALYGLPSVLLAIKQTNYKLAKILLMNIAGNIKDFSEFDRWILDPIHELGLEANPECMAIKHIILVEKSAIRDKIIQWLQKGKNDLTESDFQLIKQEPFLLRKCFINIRDIANTPLLCAILKDDPIIANQLIELDNTKLSLNVACDKYNAHNTPLILALKRGNCSSAKALIKAGADLNCQDFRGFTPLHWACILRLNEIIELLLENGANPQSKNFFGKRAVDYYLTDIKTSDLTFNATHAKSVIDKEIISYKNDDVVFYQNENASNHREPTEHNFATQVPDYSDLFWHITGIFKNLNLSHPNHTFTKESDCFNSYINIFAPKRAEIPILQHLVVRLNEIPQKVNEIEKTIDQKINYYYEKLRIRHKEIEENKPKNRLYINMLPDEMWQYAFGFFGTKQSLSSVRLSCKRFLRLTDDFHHNHSITESLRTIDTTDILAMAVSPKGDLIATQQDPQIHLWDAQTGNLILTLSNTTKYSHLAITKNNKYICGYTEDAVHFWDIEEKKKTNSLHSYIKRLSNGRVLGCYRDNDAHWGSSIKLFDIDTMQFTKIIDDITFKDSVVAISADKKLFLYSYVNSLCINIWEVATQKVIKKIPIDSITSFQITPDNKNIICSRKTNPNELKIWNMESSKFSHTISVNSEQIHGFTLSKNGKYIAIAQGNDKQVLPYKGEVSIWDIQTGKSINTIPCSSPVIDLLFSSYDDKIISAEKNRIVIGKFSLLLQQEDLSQGNNAQVCTV